MEGQLAVRGNMGTGNRTPEYGWGGWREEWEKGSDTKVAAPVQNIRTGLITL